METINEFNKQKENTLAVLKRLINFLETGKNLGIDIDAKLTEKLKKAMDLTADEKLKIALIGGFSEGKTSIVAAWSEKYDKYSMKINEQESSDEVVSYDLGDFILFDTPGLFGHKETSDKEKYKDITRKFISEAHLVLYIVNPNNPIKASHKEELLWLFKDLNLLPRTIFVLSRFDEECDIENEDDYNKRFDIKKNTIKESLKDFGITTDTDNSLSIVAISANPFGEGIEHWLKNIDEFKKLSRIEYLQKTTTNKIKESGSILDIIESTKKSIIGDVLKKQLPIAIEADNKASAETKRFEEVYNDSLKELSDINKKMKESRNHIREFILNYFTDLILQVSGTSMETFYDFFEREIGSEGIVLNTRIENEFNKETNIVQGEMIRINTNINASIEQYDSVINKLTKQGLKHGGQLLSKGVINFTAQNIKNMRNVFAASFKFKPWGAIKIAKNLNKGLPVLGELIGIGIEIWDSIDKAQKEKKFNELKQTYKSSLEEQRKEILAMLSDDEKFINTFFPEYKIFNDNMKTIAEKMEETRQRHIDFKKWYDESKIIETEYKLLS